MFFSASATSIFSRRIFGSKRSWSLMPSRYARSAYAGRCRSRRSDLELPQATLACLVDGDVPRHDDVRVRGQADDVHGDTSLLEVVELVDEHGRVDDAA